MMVYGNREDGCKGPTGILSAVFCLLLLLSFLSACGKGEKNSAAEKASDTVKVDTTALLVRQISNCARLYTTEYQYHKIVTYSDEPRITGNLGSANFSIPTRLGERKIAIPIDVSVKAYIDFALFVTWTKPPFLLQRRLGRRASCFPCSTEWAIRSTKPLFLSATTSRPNRYKRTSLSNVCNNPI